jgi:hypothetical protein
MTLGRGSSAAFAALALLIMLPLGPVLGCRSYDAALLRAVDPSDQDAGALPPGCGDGVVAGQESCDVGISSGTPGACPGTCTSEDPCMQVAPVGTACQAQCITIPITAALSGDGCCPPDVGAADDSDCGVCGDGIVGPAERCDPPEMCPTRELCTQGSACIFGIYVGDPDQCNAYCRAGATEDCENGDGCCPAGCNTETDDDCSASCGDGVIQAEAGETCEVDDASFPCPASCDDGMACTSDLASGSVENCNLECAHVDIVAATDGDGCCLPGADATTDSDCSPFCGNDVVEGSEQCDPCPSDCDDSDPCTTDSQAGSASNCDVICSHAPVTASLNGADACCPNGANATNDTDCDPKCGNNVREPPGEGCDGEGYCGKDCQRALPTSTIHRYRFTGSGMTVTDSIGSSNGMVVGDSLDGDGKVTLAGGTSEDYIDLPNGIISPLTNATFEAWMTWTNTTVDHVRIFDFGNSGGGEGNQSSAASPGYLYFSGGHDTSRHARLSFSRDGSTIVSASATAQTPANTIVHFAAVFDDTSDKLFVYMNGAPTPVATATLTASDHLSALNDVNNWLGRS